MTNKEGESMTDVAWLVADCETGGVDVFSDRIIQFVIATADEDGNLLANWEWVLNPGVEISEESVAVHGFSNEYLQEHGVSADIALEEIRRVLESYPHAVWTLYNANFDLSILAAEFERYGVWYNFGDWVTEKIRVFDALVVDRAKDRYRKGNRKLMTVAEHYGVDYDPDKLHNALYDVEITAKVAAKVAKKYGIPSNSEQAEMHETWRSNFEEYLRRTDPEAVVDGGWPLRT